MEGFIAFTTLGLILMIIFRGVILYYTLDKYYYKVNLGIYVLLKIILQFIVFLFLGLGFPLPIGSLLQYIIFYTIIGTVIIKVLEMFRGNLEIKSFIVVYGVLEFVTGVILIGIVMLLEGFLKDFSFLHIVL